MASKLVVFIAALAMANAVPIWVIAPTNDPNIGRSPSLAYGFGSGFSSDVAGIKHSTSIGTSFSTGDASAYGEGIGRTGNSFARGVGAANVPQNNLNNQHNQQRNNDFGRSGHYFTPSASALSSAQSYNNQQFGSAAANAQNIQGQYQPQYQPHPKPQYQPHPQPQPQYQPQPQQQPQSQYQSHPQPQPHPQYQGYRAAVSNAVNNGQYQTASSAAQNQQGQNFESAVSATQHGRNYNSAISNAQSVNANGVRSATAASQDINGYKASTAHAVQQNGATVHNSGATSINGPGIQAAQSHSISYY